MTDTTADDRNRQIVLASRPQRVASVENFRLNDAPRPRPGPGQVLVRHHYLSLDPYMRGRMNESKSYTAAQPLGEVMVGATVGEVIESNRDDYAVGDRVVGMGGWQQYGLSDGKDLRKITDARVPLQAHLGVLGMPGVTAWYGLHRIVRPNPGETVVVSAASGAVGSAVGQLAKAAGCRAVGVAGGPEKCALVTGTYGFDACVDYKAGRLEQDLADAVPNGIDGFFDNVGGAVLNAALQRMNGFGRIAVCGTIAGYDGEAIPVDHWRSILVNRLSVQGFIIFEHLELWPQALRELGEAVGNGSLRYRETIAEGLEAAPQAFLGLLKGRNVGKQLVKLI